MATPFPLFCLGSLAYYQALLQEEELLFDLKESFLKRSFRNRYTIINSHGYQGLTVPVLSKNSGNKTEQVKIDYSTDWIKVHIHAVQASYGLSPFFIHYFDGYTDCLNQKPDYLYELNLRLFDWVNNQLGLTIKYSLAETFPNVEVNAEWRFSKSHNRKDEIKKTPYYPQVFEDRLHYLNNPSILDLLFNEGPYGASLLKS